jgi:regulator of nucleoside diphosphate kinase
MSNRALLLTETDHRHLSELLEDTRRGRFEDTVYIDQLERELGVATVVPGEEIPADVVTLHSRVKLDLANVAGATSLEVVLPMELNLAAGRISILSPLGTALIGRRAGDEVEYVVRGAARRARILSVQFQPESAEKRRGTRAAQEVN